MRYFCFGALWVTLVPVHLCARSGMSEIRCSLRLVDFGSIFIYYSNGLPPWACRNKCGFASEPVFSKGTGSCRVPQFQSRCRTPKNHRHQLNLYEALQLDPSQSEKPVLSSHPTSPDSQCQLIRPIERNRMEKWNYMVRCFILLNCHPTGPRECFKARRSICPHRICVGES